MRVGSWALRPLYRLPELMRMPFSKRAQLLTGNLRLITFSIR